MMPNVFGDLVVRGPSWQFFAMSCLAGGFLFLCLPATWRENYISWTVCRNSLWDMRGSRKEGETKEEMWNKGGSPPVLRFCVHT